jgi:hypothetical protein
MSTEDSRAMFIVESRAESAVIVITIAELTIPIIEDKQRIVCNTQDHFMHSTVISKPIIP